MLTINIKPYYLVATLSQQQNNNNMKKNKDKQVRISLKTHKTLEMIMILEDLTTLKEAAKFSANTTFNLLKGKNNDNK